jgi:hypothetical protein
MGLFKRHTERYDKGLSAHLLEASPSDTKLIESLLSQGADPNVYKRGKVTPLIAAAKVGCIPTMEVLVKHGADIEHGSIVTNQWTPLEAAVYGGHTEAVQFLLDHGAVINGKMFMGPPFRGAFATKNLPMLKYLLDHGADPNKKLTGFKPAKIAALELGCDNFGHDIRKLPVPGCAKCGNRLVLLQMLSLLRQYGGRPMNEGCSTGTGLIDAYVDLIANIEKWEERGTKAVEAMADATLNDPTIRGILGFIAGGVLGMAGIPMPITSLESAMGIPDFPLGGPDFEKWDLTIKPEDRTRSKKYRAATESYKSGLESA